MTENTTAAAHPSEEPAGFPHGLHDFCTLERLLSDDMNLMVWASVLDLLKRD
jgi:hypothetical protein